MTNYRKAKSRENAPPDARNELTGNPSAATLVKAEGGKNSTKKLHVIKKYGTQKFFQLDIAVWSLHSL